MMKLGSLFDGSGGFPLAATLTGIEPIWASEVEPFPIAVTRSRFPNMKHLGNVSKINGAEIEPVDIITFGSPCQDLSVAGKQVGLDGERSGLFFQAVRIIKEMRDATNGVYPTYVVWENVPGAFSSNRGSDFHAVLEALCGIKEKVSVSRPKKWRQSGEILGHGWSVAWRTLDAQYWGVPQRRRRIFVVADYRGGGAGKILFESEGVSGYSHESFQAWQSSSRITENYTGEAIGVENHSQDSRYKLTGDITESLSTKMGTGGNNVPLVAFRESGILNFKEDGCSGTIRAQGGNWGHYYSIQRTDQYKESRIASTVAARDYKSSTGLIVERK